MVLTNGSAYTVSECRSSNASSGGGARTRRGPVRRVMKFTELVRLLEENGFRVVKEKGSIRYYGKRGWQRLIRVDFHGAKEGRPGLATLY